MIDRILQWLGWSPPRDGDTDVIAMFMYGASIPSLSASAGQDMIARQRQIEAEIRSYILELEHEIDALRSKAAVE